MKLPDAILKLNLIKNGPPENFWLAFFYSLRHHYHSYEEGSTFFFNIDVSYIYMYQCGSKWQYIEKCKIKLSSLKLEEIISLQIS